jgi:hypothetical protein
VSGTSPSEDNNGLKQFFASIPWLDFVKPVVVTGLSTAPITVANIFLPFVNPKIIQDVWWPTVGAMIVAGGLACVTTISNSGTVRRLPGYLSGAVFVLALGTLLALTGDVIMVNSNYAALLARAAVIGLFVGIAGFAAFFLTWVLSPKAA